MIFPYFNNINHNHMKKTALILCLLGVSVVASAWSRKPSRENSSMPVYPKVSTRSEIIIPQVNGYEVLKTDLHVHTFFSDGNVSPSMRVTEGWRDGLDAIAITDHIEYRPTEWQMKQFLSSEITENATNPEEVPCDLNFSVSIARGSAANLGMVLIPGIEITRDPNNIGHFNALFTKDNNLIPNPDPLTAIRNAKKQGAIVMSNHPGWRNPNNDFTPIAKAALEEGLVDGVEVFNDTEFYPDVIESAGKLGLYVAGNTDIHDFTADVYRRYGAFRNMTLVFSKEKSLEGIREALENRKTLAYAYGDIAGDETLLKDLFKASVDVKVVCVKKNGAKQVMFTNKSSFPYLLRIPGQRVDVPLEALSSIICEISGDSIPVVVCNMWYGPDKHPEIVL